MASIFPVSRDDVGGVGASTSEVCDYICVAAKEAAVAKDAAASAAARKLAEDIAKANLTAANDILKEAKKKGKRGWGLAYSGIFIV